MRMYIYDFIKKLTSVVGSVHEFWKKIKDLPELNLLFIDVNIFFFSDPSYREICYMTSNKNIFYLKVMVNHFRKNWRVHWWPLVLILGTSFHLPKMSWTHVGLTKNMAFGATNSRFFKKRAYFDIKIYIIKYLTRL